MTSLAGSDPLLDIRSIALNPTEDREWVNGDTAFQYHLDEIMNGVLVLAVPPYTQQYDLNRTAAALEDRQPGSSFSSRPSLNCPD